MKLLQNISAKQRVYFLPLGFLVFLLLINPLTFKKTWILYRNLRENQQAKEQAENAPERISQYQAQLAKLDRQFQQVGYDREVLFEKVNTFCQEHQLSLSNFDTEHRKTYQDYEIVSSPIAVSGTYADIVALAYFLEREAKMGYIASLQYELVRDIVKKKSFLTGTIYLQNIQAKS